LEGSSAGLGCHRGQGKSQPGDQKWQYNGGFDRFLVLTEWMEAGGGELICSQAMSLEDFESAETCVLHKLHLMED
jgi:hypothetical protein